MATGVGSPSSRLDPDPDRDPDLLPLAGRRRGPVGPVVPRADRGPALVRCDASADGGGVSGAAQQSWPGLPRGVEFNPSDSDLLWHLAAEVGNGPTHRHPFISEFIRSVDDDRRFSCTHPRDIPGVRQDGCASYFFHRRFELYNNENDENISWQRIGTPRSIILDETLQGCKEVFVLYADVMSDDNPQKTDWILHQYHIRNTVKDEELVVSKIFYDSWNNRCELAEKAPAESERDVSTPDDSKEEAQVESHSVDLFTESNFVQDNGNNQKRMQGEMYGNQNNLTSSKDVSCTTGFNPGIQTNGYTETDELDHISLQERYKILLADNSSRSATISAGKYVMVVGTSETTSERNHEGTAYREDIGNMLQEISSAPPIIESNPIHDDNNRRLLGEDLSDAQMSLRECSTLSSAYSVVSCSPDGPTNNSNDFVLPNGLCQQTHEAEHGTFLVDVKLEPALEGYEIVPSECPRAKSNHSSKNVGLVGAGSSPQAKNTLAEGSVPSLGVKSELTEGELPGLCENSSINTAEHVVKTTRTRILDHDGGISFHSRQRRKRKTASYSTDKTLEEGAYTNVEGIAYCSRRRRKKTATDSIEKALDEDAPGLLEILLNRGITVEEIKLYGAEEDDEMLPDSTESNFENLENVITKLFPQRTTSLLKLPAARYEKGERAIYSLSCLISLIEQSRYLQFRDCPVEWGWCRDLQSFIFVFRSHNRIVLERPEYGYATYFFEVVRSLPIKWQIRRLITAMKLSGCGRTALIENRPLLVGEDLTEGEAQVLQEYGWIRNTGLGTMLNYRDRVVHDRWTEKSVADWKVKIGKVLMTGYAEGQTIATHVPKKVADLLEYTDDIETEIKLEDPF